MAAFNHGYHGPGSPDGELMESVRIAYDEGHGADIPSNEGVLKPQIANTQKLAINEEVGAHSEKAFIIKESSRSDATPERDVESAQPAAATTKEEEQDPNVVFWDGPDDPANPLNWPASTKWAQIGILSLLSLLSPLASTMFVPGVPEVIKEFHSDNVSLATFVVSVYILGFAAGPLVIAPLSELYGRVIVYHVCNVGLIALTVACASAQNMGQLIGFRFLAGCFGVAPITNGGGSIADLMVPAQRGGAMAIWGLGVLIGPVIGPVVGGYLSQAEGWRWIFWVLVIAFGVVATPALFFLRETYGPTLLARKVKRLQKETGNTELRSKLGLQLGPKELFVRAITRPAKLMLFSPICALMNLYMGFVYAILYLLFTTFTFVFEDRYGFSQGSVGLVYIGVGAGMIVGLAVLGLTSDRLMKHFANKYNGGMVKPEYRLPLLILAGPAIPVGLFIYGWTTQYHIQWAVPLLGTLILGIGMMTAFMSIITYLVDAFSLYEASAMAANTVLRSVFGAVFPLFALDMYDRLGLGWGNSLVAFIAIGMCPIPWLFYIYGEKLRTHPKFQIKF